MDLEGTRQTGFATGPIPFTALVEWARVHRLDRDDFMLLKRVIGQLDSDRCAVEASKQKTKGKKR
jgi:hypothetical protein